MIFARLPSTQGALSALPNEDDEKGQASLVKTVFAGIHAHAKKLGLKRKQYLALLFCTGFSHHLRNTAQQRFKSEPKEAHGTSRNEAHAATPITLIGSLNGSIVVDTDACLQLLEPFGAAVLSEKLARRPIRGEK